jgi:hypothetical protein
MIFENRSISELLTDGSNNAFITDTEHLSFMEKSLNGSKKFSVLREIFLSDHLGFRFPNNDFMFKSFNRIITQLHESGISDWIVKNESFINFPKARNDPVVLTMRHLGVWFYLCVFMLTVATFAFFSEFLVHKLQGAILGLNAFQKDERRHGQKDRAPHSTLKIQSLADIDFHELQSEDEAAPHPPKKKRQCRDSVLKISKTPSKTGIEFSQ